MDQSNSDTLHDTSAPGWAEDRDSLISELKQENEELKKELDLVVKTAADNERIWRQFAEIERILFRTRDLGQLAQDLLREIKSRFQPDQAVLLVCHPDILERFFPDISRESEPVTEESWILPLPTEIASSLCGTSAKPSMPSKEEIDDLLRFFPENVTPIRSGVMIPLALHEILYGGLFLGSVDQDRYRPRDGTDLLEQLGLKIALCMENCLTYERAKDFAVQDPVTGLLNFFQIQTLLDRSFRKARLSRTPLSIFIIHLRFLSNVQEQIELRNEILKHAANILSEILPEGESSLGRYGGDEFLVLLPDVTGNEAKEVAPYLTHMIRKSPFIHAKTAILIHALIGVGTLQDSMQQSEDLLNAAYLELFRLKSAL
jgi:diguanylate cyclase (GGDEF)-like protein